MSVNKIASQHEDEKWLDKVYENIQNSVNDMPFLRIINKLRNSIDNHKTPGKKLSYLQDSMIITDNTTYPTDHHTIDNAQPHVLLF